MKPAHRSILRKSHLSITHVTSLLADASLRARSLSRGLPSIISAYFGFYLGCISRLKDLLAEGAIPLKGKFDATVHAILNTQILLNYGYV